MRADDVPERRADQRRLAHQHVVGAVHRDAGRAANRAPRAVGRDHVARLDRALRPRAHVAQRGAGAAQPGDLGAEQHAVRGELRQQQRLDVVLRDAGRLDRAQHAALRTARVADADRVARRGGRERLGLEHREVDVGAALAHGVLQPPAAHQLHRAEAEHGGARVRGQDAAALDQQRRDVVARELDRGREAGRAGAGDQDGGLHGRHRGRAARAAHEQSLLNRRAVDQTPRHAVAARRARSRARVRRRGAGGRLGRRRRGDRPGRRRQDPARRRGRGARGRRGGVGARDAFRGVAPARRVRPAAARDGAARRRRAARARPRGAGRARGRAPAGPVRRRRAAARRRVGRARPSARGRGRGVRARHRAGGRAGAGRRARVVEGRAVRAARARPAGARRRRGAARRRPRRPGRRRDLQRDLGR